MMEKKVKDLSREKEKGAKSKTEGHPDMVELKSNLEQAQEDLKRAQQELARAERLNYEYQASDVRGGQERGTILTMRAKKKDIDALAQGTINFEAFEQKLEQQAYAGYGHGVTSVNSWAH